MSPDRRGPTATPESSRASTEASRRGRSAAPRAPAPPAPPPCDRPGSRPRGCPAGCPRRPPWSRAGPPASRWTGRRSGSSAWGSRGSRGRARARPWPAARSGVGGCASAPSCRAMSHVDADGAAREASGAHPYGRYLEEFEVGAVYKHWPAKTVTEADDHLFCLITMNHHPLHINDVYAAQSQQGRNVVVGPLVYSLALGMSVSDVSGKAIANLATEELTHPAPVFHGDTLFAESEVLEVTPSRSKPDRGVVKVHTRVYKQDGTLVAEFKRLVLVPRKNPGAVAADEDGVPGNSSGD